MECFVPYIQLNIKRMIYLLLCVPPLPNALTAFFLTAFHDDCTAESCYQFGKYDSYKGHMSFISANPKVQ